MTEAWFVVSGAWQEKNLWAGIDRTDLVQQEGELPEWQLHAAYHVGGGQLDKSRIPFRMKVQEGHYGTGRPDFIWAGTDPTKLVSTELVDVLDHQKFSGYQVFDVPFVDRKGEPVDGYRGLQVLRGQDGPRDLRPLGSGNFLARESVIDALIAAGVKKFRAEEADDHQLKLAEWSNDPTKNSPPEQAETGYSVFARRTTGPAHKCRFVP